MISYANKTSDRNPISLKLKEIAITFFFSSIYLYNERNGSKSRICNLNQQINRVEHTKQCTSRERGSNDPLRSNHERHSYSIALESELDLSSLQIEGRSFSNVKC